MLNRKKVGFDELHRAIATATVFRSATAYKIKRNKCEEPVYCIFGCRFQPNAVIVVQMAAIPHTVRLVKIFRILSFGHALPTAINTGNRDRTNSSIRTHKHQWMLLTVRITPLFRIWPMRRASRPNRTKCIKANQNIIIRRPTIRSVVCKYETRITNWVCDLINIAHNTSWSLTEQWKKKYISKERENHIFFSSSSTHKIYSIGGTHTKYRNGRRERKYAITKNFKVFRYHKNPLSIKVYRITFFLFVFCCCWMLF